MQNKMHFINRVCALVTIVLLVGCASPIPTPTPLPTSTFTLVPVPTQTSTVTQTLTVAPSPIRTVTQVVQTQVGWVAQHGSPDNARANLSAKLVLQLKLIWEWKEANDSPQAVAIANGQVFLLTTRGQFCILDARTGANKTCSPIWQDVTLRMV